MERPTRSTLQAMQHDVLLDPLPAPPAYAAVIEAIGQHDPEAAAPA